MFRCSMLGLSFSLYDVFEEIILHVFCLSCVVWFQLVGNYPPLPVSEAGFSVEQFRTQVHMCV